jgi:PcfJ-like protein
MYKRSIFVVYNGSGALFCSCGHHHNFALDEKEGEKEPLYKCPKCGNTNHFYLYTDGYNRIFNEVAVYDNGDKVSLSVKVGVYFWNQMIEKITYTDHSFRLTFNTKTGNLYLIQGKKIRNITFGKITKKFYYLFNDLMDRYEDKLEEFVSLCFQKRGIVYKGVKNFKQYQFAFWDAVVYAKYPQLQNIPIQISYIPVYMRKPLKMAKTKREIYKVLFGTNAKTVFQHVKRNEDYTTLHVISQAVKLPENMVKLLSITRLETRYEMNGEEIFLPFDEQKAKKIEEEVPVRIMSHTYSIFPDYYFSETPTLVHALRFFVKIFSETRFVNKVVKESRQEAFYKNGLNIYSILEDTYRMYRDITKINPSYKVRWNKHTFLELHDLLSKDVERYRHQNQIIPYKEKERELEEKHEDYTIQLAPDTDFLIDIGSQMGICVGSYGTMAVQKQTTIAVLYKEGKPHICIEIGRNREIKQAKLKYNNIPEREDALLVRDWAKRHKLKWRYCIDLQNAI